MGKRTQQLIDELKGIEKQYYSKCSHGGIRYPVQWMSKTQDLAIEKGILAECEKCKTSEYRYFFINK